MEDAQGTRQPGLAELVDLNELQKIHIKRFQTRISLEWHLRKHRDAYLRGGALFEIAGRLLVHPGTFSRVALEIGRLQAESRRPEKAANT